MTVRTSMTLAVGAALLVGFATGYLVPKPPRNRADCYLRYVKAGMSDEVGGFVVRACMDKFEEPASKQTCNLSAILEPIKGAASALGVGAPPADSSTWYDGSRRGRVERAGALVVLAEVRLRRCMNAKPGD